MNIKYSLYRLKWNLSPYFNFKSPIHIDIELTNKCNQSCIMCWHSNKKLPFKLSEMSRMDILSLLEDARIMGAMSCKFQWRGESTLSEHISDAINYAKSIGYIDTMLNTNGIMSLEKLHSIIESGLDTLIISVDSFDETIYRKIHNCSQKQYETMLGTIQELSMLYRLDQLKTKVKLNFHINEYNKNDISIAMNRNAYPFEFIIRDTEKREGKDISVKKKERKRKRMCPHMMRRLTISADCKIYPCCVSYLESKDLYLGRSPEFAWNHGKRKELIKNYKKGIYTESCKQCTSGDIYK